MLLKNIADKLCESGLLSEYIDPNENTEIEYITFDSRNVKENTLFTCKGAKFKSEYLVRAMQKGAVAYMSEEKYDVSAPSIIVNDIRKAMSITAMYFYGYPSEAMNTIGITGTKGKTTTAFFLKNIFDAYTDAKNAAITTIEVMLGNEKKKAVLTTPEAYDLQAIFAEARDEGVKNIAMEVSSQALKTERVYGMKYDVGIFLNIDDDHISPNEHQDWNDYFQSKLKLFRLCETAVINGDDPHADAIIGEAKKYSKNVLTYGRGASCTYRLNDVRRNGEYLDFEVVSPDNKINTYTLAMHGSFNAENALAAIITAKHFGVDDESIKRGLKATLVPGRMDMFYNAETDVKVVVDFAHNKLSFNKLFESLKEEYPDRRLGVVIGSAGGKGFQRRKAIGEVLTKYADYAILTDCDSNFEDTESICRDIMQYIGENGPECRIILDREEAITTALKEAKRGDVIALVARGEESRRWWKGEILECVSDVELARRYCEGTL